MLSNGSRAGPYRVLKTGSSRAADSSQYPVHQAVLPAAERHQPGESSAGCQLLPVAPSCAPVASGDGARGVVHGFTGDRVEAEAFLGMGLDIGITGWVSDLKRGRALREAVSTIPLDRLHLETDAPYLLPKNPGVRRGHKESAPPPWIAVSVAELMKRDVEEIIRACSDSSRRMFGLPSV